MVDEDRSKIVAEYVGDRFFGERVETHYYMSWLEEQLFATREFLDEVRTENIELRQSVMALEKDLFAAQDTAEYYKKAIAFMSQAGSIPKDECF